MAIYGLYVRNLASGELTWFKSNRALEAGEYSLSERPVEAPEVYIAESIPALLLRVGRIIDEAERNAQQSSDSPQLGEDVKRHVQSSLTAHLLQRLTETSSIWESDPRWLGNLVRYSRRM